MRMEILGLALNRQNDPQTLEQPHPFLDHRTIESKMEERMVASGYEAMQRN